MIHALGLLHSYYECKPTLVPGLFFNLTFFLLDILPTFNFINLTFFLPEIWSSYHFMNYLFHQIDIFELAILSSLYLEFEISPTCHFQHLFSSDLYFNSKTSRSMGLYHPPDGVTNLKYKLLYFLTPIKKNSKRKALAFNRDRCCHLAICLRLIPVPLKLLFKSPG